MMRFVSLMTNHKKIIGIKYVLEMFTEYDVIFKEE